METRYTFLERKTYDALPGGRVRVYYDEQEAEESVTTKDEGGEEHTDTHSVYRYLAADAASFGRNDIIVALIRAKYSVDDELAIQRQRESKPEEFSVYNDYVEWCKTFADSIID